MTRVLLTIVLPLLAPAALYAVWFLFARRSAAARAADPGAPPPRVPWLALFLAGAALAAVSLVWIAAVGGDAPWGDHRPPSWRDGAVIPGGSG